MRIFSILLTTLAFTYATNAVGQNRINYHSDIFERTFTKVEIPPMFGQDSLDLQRYLAERLSNEIPRTKGQIKVSLLIDTSGKALCESIDNNSNFRLNKTKLNLLFDSMPNWSSGIQNGYKVNCVELIVMTFDKKSLKVAFRTGRDH